MKRSLTFCAAGAALALLAACSSTSPSATADASAPAQAVATTDNLTCRTIIKTGTRLGTRVCKTDEQWKQESMDSRDAATGIQNNSAQSAGPGGG